MGYVLYRVLFFDMPEGTVYISTLWEDEQLKLQGHHRAPFALHLLGFLYRAYIGFRVYILGSRYSIGFR